VIKQAVEPAKARHFTTVEGIKMNANNNAVQMNDDIENYLPIEGVHRFVEYLIELGAIKNGFDAMREFYEFDFDKED
jgi:hypothetical protein